MSLILRAVSCIIFMIISSKFCEFIINCLIASFSYILIGISTFSFRQLNLQVSFSYFAFPNILLGEGIMFAFIQITKLAISTIEKEKLYIAAGLHSLSKCAFTAFIISISNAFFISLSQIHQPGFKFIKIKHGFCKKFTQFFKF